MSAASKQTRIAWQGQRGSIAGMVEAGMTFAEIGVIVGASETATATACHRMGIKVPRAVKSRRACHNIAALWQTAEYRQRVAQGLQASDGIARGRGAVVRRWCPASYVELYFDLVHKHGIKGGEARAMVLRQIGADERRARAAATAEARAQRGRHGAFDRLLARIAAGEVELVERGAMMSSTADCFASATTLAGL